MLLAAGQGLVERNASTFVVVGIVLGVIGVAATIWAVWYQRKPKTFDWTILLDQALGGEGRPLGRLKLSWDNKELKRPRFLVMQLQNTGKREILRNDFDGPIVIRLPKTQVVSASVRKRETMHGKAEFSIEGNEIRIEPCLFNPADRLTVSTIIDRLIQTDDDLYEPFNLETIEVDAVIAGESRASRRIRNFQVPTRATIALSMIITAVAAIVVIVGSLVSSNFAIQVAAVLLMIGYVGLLIPVVRVALRYRTMSEFALALNAYV